MEDVKGFWTEVNEKLVELRTSGQLEDIEGQPSPRDGFCFITSLKNRQMNTTPGAVSLAVLKLAAQRLVEGTHDLSSADDIQRFNDQQEANLAEAQAQVLEDKTQYIARRPATRSRRGAQD